MSKVVILNLISFSYHLGSVAFGALLLATVKFIRALLDYLDKKLSTAQNGVAKFIMLYVDTIIVR